MRLAGIAVLMVLGACTDSAGGPTTTIGTTESTEASSTPSEPAVTTTNQPEWVELAPMGVARSEHPAVVFDGEIVVTGGFVEAGLGRSDVTAAVEAYSPETDTWRELPGLPEPVHHGMAAAAGERLFIIGGFGIDGEPIASVWELSNGEWVERASLPGPLGAAATAVVDSSIYVVGGVPDSAFYRYDPAGDTWVVLPAPSQEREHVAAAMVGGEVWAIAGRWQGEIRDSTEVYDPEEGAWRPGPPLNDARSGFGAVAVAGLIVAAGGEVFSPDSALDSVEILDTDTGAWSLREPLPIGLHGNPLVAIGDDVYLPGGSTQPAGVENDGRMYRLSLG